MALARASCNIDSAASLEYGGEEERLKEQRGEKRRETHGERGGGLKVT